MNKKIKHSLVNIGTGEDKTINEYAKVIMNYLKVKFKIKNDLSKPDGTKRKLLNVSLAKKLGWRYKTTLKQGIQKTLSDLKYID